MTATQTAPCRKPAALPFLLTRPGVLLLIGLYIAAHLAIRFLISPTLGLDDAEQVLVGQKLALGYLFRQPPLYTWVAWAAFQVFGVSLFTMMLVHYAVLGLGYVFLYLAARRLTGDALRAALILFSFALIYVFAYYALHDLSHSLALASLIAANLYFLLGLVQRGRWSDYLLFGLTLGLGVLSKYNFLLYLVAALLAAALVPQLRARLYSLRGLAGFALALAVALPYWLWVATKGYSLFGLTARVVRAEEAEGLAAAIDRRLAGLWDLFASALEFPFPFLIVLALLLPGLLLRPASAPDPWGLRRFLGWHMVFGMGLMLAAVLIFGASQFKARWFHPILIPLPFFLFARLAAADLPRRRVRLFIAAAAAAVLLAMVGRLAEDRLRAANCDLCRVSLPLAEIAERLSEAGFARGTIVAGDHHIGGNLLVHFPDSRVLEPAFPMHIFPPDPVAEQCLIVWDEASPGLPDNLAHFIATNLRAELGGRERDGLAVAAFGPDRSRRFALSFILIQGGSGDCR